MHRVTRMQALRTGKPRKKRKEDQAIAERDSRNVSA